MTGHGVEIEIVVAPDGKVTTKVKNGRGKSCRDVTKAIRDALGETVEDKPLPEFYATTAATVTVRGGGGK